MARFIVWQCKSWHRRITIHLRGGRIPMAYKPGKATIAAVTLAFSTTLIPLAPASAGMISTDRIIEQTQTNADRERVNAFVARDDIRKEFQKQGVNPDEAAA